MLYAQYLIRNVHDWSANSLDVYYPQRSKSGSLPTWQRNTMTINCTPAKKIVSDSEVSLSLLLFEFGS